jgi:hypothetical protein
VNETLLVFVPRCRKFWKRSSEKGGENGAANNKSPLLEGLWALGSMGIDF